MSNEKLDFAKLFEEARNKKALTDKISALDILKKQFEKQYPNINSKAPNPNLRIYKVTFETYCDISLALIQALDDNQENAQVLNQANQVLQSIYKLAPFYSPENYQMITQLLKTKPDDCPDLALSLASILSLLAKAYVNTKKHDKALECFNNALDLIKSRFGDVLTLHPNTVLEKNRLLRDIFNNIQLAKADFLSTFECYEALPQGVTRRTATDIYLQLIKWINDSKEPYSAEELALMQYNIAVNIRKEAMELRKNKHDNKLTADKYKEAAGFNVEVILADRDIRGDNEYSVDDDAFVLAEDFNKNLAEASELQSAPVVRSVPESKSDSMKWQLYIAYIATREQLDSLKNSPSNNEFLSKSLNIRLQHCTAKQEAKLAEIAKLKMFAVAEKSPAQMASPAPVRPAPVQTPPPARVQAAAPVSAPAPASAATPAVTSTGDQAEPLVVRKRKVFTFVTDNSVASPATSALSALAPKAAASAPAPAPSAPAPKAAASAPAPSAPAPKAAASAAAPSAPAPKAAASAPAPSAPAPRAPVSATAVKEPARQAANSLRAAYKPREQETFMTRQDESIKANVVIKDWNGLDDEIYAAARTFNADFNSLSSHTKKYQMVDKEGCLVHKILIVPPADLSPAEKLAYGKRILDRLKTVYGIARNTHLEEASARKNEHYNEYFTKGKTGIDKPKKIGNILPNNAVEGTVAIYGSTASVVTAIVVKNRPGFKPVSQGAELADSDKVEKVDSPVKASAPAPAPKKQPVKFIAANNDDEPDVAEKESPKRAIESKPSESAAAPKKKKKSGPDQKAIDSRAAAFFVTTFKTTFKSIQQMDVFEQIGAVESLVEMYIQAVVDNPKKISYHVTNIYVAALILRIDAYMVFQQYQEVLQECQSLKVEFKDHGKYQQEASRLEGLCKVCSGMLNPQEVQNAEAERVDSVVQAPINGKHQESQKPASQNAEPVQESVLPAEQDLQPWSPYPENHANDDPAQLTDEEDEADPIRSATRKRASVEDLLQAVEKPVEPPVEKPAAPSELKKRAVDPEPLEDLSKYPATYKFFKTPSPPRTPAVESPAPVSPPRAPAVKAPAPVSPRIHAEARKSISRIKQVPAQGSAKKPAPRKRGETTDQMRLLSTVPGKKAKEHHQEERSNNNAPK